jgi:UDP-2,4-diacetamido-2,4,6-trideoxy-beta-L-altropyranose hydrolase
MHSKRILFCADGDSTIGLGHIYRCLSLIDMLKDNFNCVFILKNNNSSIINIVRSYCEVILLNNQESEIDQLRIIVNSNVIVVLDGYNYDINYQKFIKSRGSKLVVVDDYANNEYFADVIINHGDSSVEKLYKKENYTKTYTGLNYLILRKEFLHLASLYRKPREIDTAYICFGGADPNNNTLKVLDACFESGIIRKVYIVTGAAYKHNGIEERINKYNTLSIIHKKNINPNEIIDLLLQSQIAICPSSTVSLEACCAKVGLLTGTIIENQKYIHKELVDLNCALSIDDFNTATVNIIAQKIIMLKKGDVLNQIINNQAKYIDGKSNRNILSIFQKLAV